MPGPARYRAFPIYPGDCRERYRWDWPGRRQPETPSDRIHVPNRPLRALGHLPAELSTAAPPMLWLREDQFAAGICLDPERRKPMISTTSSARRSRRRDG